MRDRLDIALMIDAAREEGRHPGLETLWRLAVALDLSDADIARVVRACGEAP